MLVLKAISVTIHTEIAITIYFLVQNSEPAIEKVGGDICFIRQNPSFLTGISPL
jgi:hypothetical protein